MAKLKYTEKRMDELRVGDSVVGSGMTGSGVVERIEDKGNEILYAVCREGFGGGIHGILLKKDDMVVVED